MSNVASLELCKELYELSHWSGTTHQFYPTSKHGEAKAEPTRAPKDYEWQFPAYDLGWLLRKLPKSECVVLDYQVNNDRWFIGGKTEIGTNVFADTPEDAACKLLIKLIEEKVITV